MVAFNSKRPERDSWRPDGKAAHFLSRASKPWSVPPVRSWWNEGDRWAQAFFDGKTTQRFFPPECEKTGDYARYIGGRVGYE